MLNQPAYSVPKPNFKRRTPRRAARGKFSDKTRQAILERDNGCCVRCGTSQNLESVPHHILFKSQMGRGTVDNGVTICCSCHREAHKYDSVRRWFEEYRLKYLV
jgi:5-methylcytosine-specific restriction endonuclease McrA